MQSAYELIRLAALRSPAATAIADDETRSVIDYRDLVDRISRLAAGMRAAGLRPGNRVAVVLGNCPEAVLTVLVLHRAEAVPALVNPRLKIEEQSRLIRSGDMSGAVLESSSALRAEIPTIYSGVRLCATIGGSGPLDVSAVARAPSSARVRSMRRCILPRARERSS